jgi:hypothetical protein
LRVPVNNGAEYPGKLEERRVGHRIRRYLALKWLAIFILRVWRERGDERPEEEGDGDSGDYDHGIRLRISRRISNATCGTMEALTVLDNRLRNAISMANLPNDQSSDYNSCRVDHEHCP